MSPPDDGGWLACDVVWLPCDMVAVLECGPVFAPAPFCRRLIESVLVPPTFTEVFDWLLPLDGTDMFPDPGSAALTVEDNGVAAAVSGRGW